MADAEIVWPMGMTGQDPDLADRALVFNPRGFLVAILTDAHEAGRAATALRAAGFAERRLRIYSSAQILADHERFTAQRSTARRVVGALTDDQETIDLYFGHARDGRAALWVHVTDDDQANRAIRGLAGHGTLHLRHFGHGRQSDFYLQRPTV